MRLNERVNNHMQIVINEKSKWKRRITAGILSIGLLMGNLTSTAFALNDVNATKETTANSEVTDNVKTKNETQESEEANDKSALLTKLHNEIARVRNDISNLKNQQSTDELDTVTLSPTDEDKDVEEIQELDETEYADFMKQVEADDEKRTNGEIVEDDVLIDSDKQETETKLTELEAKLTDLKQQYVNAGGDSSDLEVKVRKRRSTFEDRSADNNEKNLVETSVSLEWSNYSGSIAHQDWTDGSKDIKAIVKYTIKSNKEINRGALQILVPSQIYKDRNGNKIGDIAVGVPRFPNMKQPIAYTIVNGDLKLINVHKLPKVVNAYVEFTYKAPSPELVKDLSTNYISDAVFARLKLQQDGFIDADKPNSDSGLITKDAAEVLKTDVDTKAHVNSVSGNEGYAYESFADIYPTELKSETTSGEKVYADYTYYVDYNATQPYKLKFEAEALNYGGRVIGVRNNYDGKIMKGSGPFDIAIANDYESSNNKGFYMHVFVEYDKSNFTSNTLYNLDVKGTYTITALDDQEVSSASKTINVGYKPIIFEAPDNHFGSLGYGDGEHTRWTGMDVIGMYNYALNSLANNKDVDIKYQTHAYAWTLPYTNPGFKPTENNKDPRLSAYKKEKFGTDVQDFGIDTDTEGFDINYELKDITLSSFAMYDYVKYDKSGYGYIEGSDGLVQYRFVPIGYYGYKAVDKIEDLDIADKTYTFEVYGTRDGVNYEKQADAVLNGSDVVFTGVNGATGEQNKLTFAHGMHGYRISLNAGIPGYLYNVGSTYTIKADEKSKAMAEHALSKDVPLHRIRVNGDMIGHPAVSSFGEGSLNSTPHAAYDELMGVVEGVRSSSDLTYTNDVENTKVNINFVSDTMFQTNQLDLKDLQEAVDKKYFREETTGTYYVLLPQGVDLKLNSVEVDKGKGNIKNKQLIKNFRNSGRDLLKVELEHTPNYKMRFGSQGNANRYSSFIGVDGYMDKIQISYKGSYPWAMLQAFGDKLRVDTVYVSDGDSIGTLKKYLGEDSSASTTQNVYTKLDKDLLGNINNETDDKDRYVFDIFEKTITVETASVVSLSKLVDVNFENEYTNGLSLDEPKNVYEKGSYTYRLTMSNHEKNPAHNLVLYDKLDSYVLNKKEDDEFGAKTFKGVLNKLNLDFVKSLHIKPIVYYATDADIKINGQEDNDLNLNNGKWSTEKPEDNSKITAIAIDLSKKEDGSDFELKERQSVQVDVQMHAPKIDNKTVFKDSFAFNQGWLSYNDQLHADDKTIVHTLKTKTGIKPFKLTITGVFDDDNDRDGKRPENIQGQVTQNGQPMEENDKKFTLNNDNKFETKIDSLQYQTEDGEVLNYGLDIINKSSDYRYVIGKIVQVEDGIAIEVKAIHEPERIDIQGHKKWQKKDGSLYEENELTRPANISVTLKANDEECDTQTVVPDKNGNWDFEFKNVYKYENKKEIVYTLEEPDYVEGYCEATYDQANRTIINTYYPLGDLLVENKLENATKQAKNSEFDYEVTIENKNKKDYTIDTRTYKYITSSGKSGEISTGGHIKLTGEETFTIKDVPSMSKIIINEKPSAGFTVMGGRQSAMIKSGRTTKMTIINCYESTGEVTLEGVKKIVSETDSNVTIKVKPFMFMFDLYNGKVTNEAIDNASCLKDLLQSTRNDNEGKVIFDQLTYSTKDLDLTTGLGEKYYTLAERNTNEQGYIYDKTLHIVKVILEDQGNGKLKITYTKVNDHNEAVTDKVLWTNKYHARGDLNMDLIKEVKDTTELPNAGEIEYTIYKVIGDVDSADAVEEVGKVTNDAYGHLKFTKKDYYTEKDINKSFIYKVRESKYDNTVYEPLDHELRIKETVKDLGNGLLSIEQEYLGKYYIHTTDSKSLRIDENDNNVPKLINTEKNGSLSITKKITGKHYEPDKEFKFKVTFAGANKNMIPKTLKVKRASVAKDRSVLNGLTMLYSTTPTVISREDFLRSSLGVSRSAATDRKEFEVIDNPVIKMVAARMIGMQEIQTLNYDSKNKVLNYILTNNPTVNEIVTMLEYDGGTIIEYYPNNGESIYRTKQYKVKDELTNEKFEVIQGWGNKDLVIKGWALKPDATKPDYSVGSLIKDSNIFEHLNEKSRVKVYAVWGKAGYTVTYHSNGGSGSMAVQDMEYGKETELHNNNFYQVGKRFIGWATKADGEVVYQGGAKLNLSENQVTNDNLDLYAVWADNDLNLQSADGTFEFTLKADEVAIIDNLASHLTYKVEEIADPAWGVVKQENVQGIIKPQTDAKAVITNEYGAKSTSVVLSGNKRYLGLQDLLQEFKFSLYEKVNGEEQKVDTTTISNLTAINQTDNNAYKTYQFDFKPITYTEPGVHHYIMREEKGNNNLINYAANEYEITIEVKEVGGKLIASGVPQADQQMFVNTGKESSITVTKKVEGTLNKEDDKPFNFKITYDTLSGSKTEEFTLTANESKSFTSYVGGTYRVEELSTGEYVTTSENANGVVKSLESEQVIFTNKSTYNPIVDENPSEDENVSVTLKKVIQDDAYKYVKPVKGQFGFQADIIDGNGKILQSKIFKNDAEGNIEVTFSKAVTKLCKKIQVKELETVYVSDGLSYKFDKSIFKRDFDTNGNIIETSSNYDKIFVNTLDSHSTNQNPLSVELKVKNLPESKKDKLFEIVTKINGKETVLKLKANEIKNLNEMPAGTKYQVTVDEKKLTKGYTLVEIKDDHDGTISNSENDPSKVVVTLNYKRNLTLQLKAKKVMLNEMGKRDDELLKKYTFSYMLMDDEEDIAGQAKSDQDGNISFGSLVYNIKDVGKTFNYDMIERNEGQYGIIFDTTIYHVTVKVMEDTNDNMYLDVKVASDKDGQIGKMRVYNVETGKLDQSDDYITFTNQYKIPIKSPITGMENSLFVVFQLFLLGAGGIVVGKVAKRKKY